MIAFPGMLVSAAKRVGMKVPPDPDNFDPNEYPHFQVFCNMQLGASMPYAGCHWDNAKVIADIPEDEIMKLTWADIVARGFHIST